MESWESIQWMVEGEHTQTHKLISCGHRLHCFIDLLSTVVTPHRFIHRFKCFRYPPFFDDNPFGIYQKILAAKLEFPRHLDFYVKDLIKKFLVIDRARRLGNMKNGADDVKKHRWFKTIDWEAVPLRKLKPPIVPKVSHEGDTSNFDVYPEDDWKKDPPVAEKDLEVFKNF